MTNSAARCAAGLCSATLLAVLMAIMMTDAALAQPEPPAAPVVQEEQIAPGPVNQQQALERVRARFPGNVIAINEVRQGNRVRFRIRLDNEGNIYTVFVDQATGAISRE
jgi:uncharacterized membrane protein YkoI